MELYKDTIIIGQTAGIVANFTGEILNCYNAGKIKGYTKGGISAWAKDISIKNCYNIGNIEKIREGENIGGIIYGIDSTSITINIINNYYLDSCGASYGKRINGQIGTNEGAEIKTEIELKNMYHALGNEFINDSENINNGYPILKWQMQNKRN